MQGVYILEYFAPGELFARRVEIAASNDRQAKNKATRHLREDNISPITKNWKTITDTYFHRVFDTHTDLKSVSLFFRRAE